jgi:HEAT repeat protein
MSTWTALELSISVKQYGEDAVPYLVEGLDLPDQSVVQFCIEMLAVIGFVSAVDPLRRLAKTYPSITVRAKAIEALGRLGDQRSEELLISFVRDPNPALRLKALEALGRIGAPAALPALLPRLEHGALQEQLAAARAIAAAGPAGLEELRRTVASGSKRQRAVGLHVLEECGA